MLQERNTLRALADASDGCRLKASMAKSPEGQRMLLELAQIYDQLYVTVLESEALCYTRRVPRFAQTESGRQTTGSASER